MKTIRLALALAALAAVSCSDSNELSREEKQYETVQEGSAAGVATTLDGSTVTPTPALTNTNADTTSAFSLDPRLVGGTATQGGQPGTIAGTMPPPMTSGTNEWGVPRQAPRPRVTAPAPAQPMTSSPPPAQNEPVIQPPAQQQDSTPAPAEPAPAESTTAGQDAGPTASQPPPAEEKKEAPKEEAPAAEPAPTSTAPPG